MTIEKYAGIEPQVANGAWIHLSAQVIGDVTLAEGVSIWPCAVLRGDVNFIRIGRDCNVQDGAVLHVTHRRSDDPAGAPLVLGERVTVGHAAVLHGCQIGNDCLIGMGAIVLDRAVVEDKVIVGAGSLVPPGKRLESGYLYLGSPVKKMRPLTEAELEGFAYSANNYLKLKEDYQKG